MDLSRLVTLGHMLSDRVGDALVNVVRLTRLLTLIWAVATALSHPYAHPWVAGGVIAGMTFWTGATAVLAAQPDWFTLGADLLLTWLAVAATALAESAAQIDRGDPTVPSTWASATVVAWAIARGPVWGGAAGLVTASASVVVRGDVTRTTLANAVLLVLVGILVGVAGQLARGAAERIAEAEASAAAERERDRLAREVHDGVLQLLTLVSRSESELVLPDGSPLSAAAAEQERSLRRLITEPVHAPVGELDLMAALPQASDISLVGPGGPVLLPAATAEALVAAAGAAIGNVRVHARTTAHVLVEDLGDRVEILVRDAGPGFDPQTVDQRRLGLRGMMERLVQVGGSMSIRTAPGEGTEITLSAPREAGR